MAKNYIINVATLGARGEGREHMEDLIWTENIPENGKNPGISIFLLADGNGCHPGCLQAEQIACPQIIEFVKKCIEVQTDMFTYDPCFFTELAVMSANKTLGGFKLGNEEKYGGYGASLTICITIGQRLHVIHTGNTRLYVIRGGKLSQLTKDQTRGQEMVDEGKISGDTYYAISESRVITGGIGFLAEPKIQTFVRKMEPDDIYVMTTDGIHMTVTGEGIQKLVLESQNCRNAADALITAASDVLHSEDDMACIVFHIAG